MNITLALVLIIVVVAGFLIAVSRQPANFRVTRSAIMDAPTPVVFAQVNDFHAWASWSPWAEMDPNAKNEFAGAPSGQGAVFKWSGNRQVGEGQMTLIESHASDVIRIKLEFFKPFVATNTAEFNFKSQGEQTLVTWSMYGPNTFMGKVMNVFINCDKMIGGQFEKGLAKMKSVVETKPAQH